MLSADCHNAEAQQANVGIVEESAAIRIAIVKAQLEAKERRQVDIDAALTRVVREVTQLQEAELAQAVLGLNSFDLEDLKTARNLEINSRHWGSLDNVLEVLTRYDGDVTDEVLFNVRITRFSFF